MLLTENGTPMTPLFAEAGYRRGNIPNGIKPQLHGPNNPEKNVRLWVVDRILEPQTVPGFLSYLSSSRLPDSTQTPHKLPTFNELKNITRPFSEWAPAPYNNHGRPTAESIGDLTNKIHNLSQNTSHADFMIDLATDGYKGDPLPSQDDLRTGGAPGRGFREQPIVCNIDDIRDACKIHWMDSKELGIPDGDIEAAKEHFNTYIKSEGAPPVQKRVLLIIDEHVIKSYLNPIKDIEKFVVMAQADYDLVFKEESVESPGYKGTVRVLRSLLWDDLGAMLLRQSVFVDWLWPLAMGNQGAVYKGPKITPMWKFTTHSETLRWEIGSTIIPWLVRYKHIAESGGRRST
ncbi:hypothetical protein FALBO_10158 [Fusarium albosuccineum]|uniref:Uncharacterized protein n=1 Tax=Fusarium albosuccineum TaxID=1237068 RepID=A0A8H4L6J0_9HYPO|nr:hypothetical protein FALBO_10158 [Fusarium albosuccineum]